MKAFIVSLITFTLLIAGVTVNCIYIEKTAGELSDAVDSLPDSPELADTSALREKWDRSKIWISLSVDHKETDEIDDTIAQIEVHIAENNKSAYESAVASLKCQLMRLAESEALSFDRIF